jgi:hypothetical protein
MAGVHRRTFLKSAAALGAGALMRSAPGGSRELPPGVRRTLAPRDAAAAALVDLLALDRHHQPFAWYVWDNTGTKESAAALNFCVNAVLSQASSIVQPVKVADGKLLRYSLLELAPRRADFERLWRELQSVAKFEPYFHQPSAEGKQVKFVKQHVAPYVASDGKRYDWRWQEIVTHRKFEFGVHAGGAGPLLLLSDLAGGNLLPIVRGDWLVCTAWTSVDIDGIHGRYYELAGIEKSKQRGQTDFDLFLKQVGADRRLDDRLKQKAVQISEVTGLWRTVEAQLTVGVRPEDGPSMLTVTRDIKDSNQREDQHGLLNLVAFKDQAREVIAPKRNGLHLFLLTDGGGALQKEAPPDVAAWPNAPWKRKRLVAGISCVECHGGNRGYNPVRNVVLENARDGFAPLADLASRVSNAETLDILKSQYLGDLEQPLRAAGNAYASAVDKATWGVFGPRSVEGASAETYRIYADYFARITPRRLLRELGYECEDKIATEVLKLVLPAAEDDDARIRTIRRGGEILRSDLDRVFYEIALRDAFRTKE